MQRIYFLVPQTAVAREIVEELVDNGVARKHIHVVAREDVPLDDLPEASLVEESDLLPAVERGLPLGAATGLFAGLVTVAVPGGLALGGAALLACTAAGAGVGTWLSAMVSLDIPNSRHREFQDAVEAGQLLMLVDVGKERVEDVESLVLDKHPQAKLGRVEPRVLTTPPSY
jgi:hypothetical protein